MQPVEGRKLNISHLIWAITVKRIKPHRGSRICSASLINVENSTMRIGATELINWDLLENLLRIWGENLQTYFCLESDSLNQFLRSYAEGQMEEC